MNEDFCDTFTGEMNPKEINRFSDKFRIISISSLSGIRNLSDAAKSRLTTIYTSEYGNEEKENAAKAYESLIPEDFFTFLLKYENGFKTKLSFLDITKYYLFTKK